MNILNVSSKFAICGLPIRADSYKSCTFGCKYCFANNREIMKFDQTHIETGNVNQLKKYLERIFDKGDVHEESLLDTLVSKRITWHMGGMSDPFQPCEGLYHITQQVVDLSNQYNQSILFSTKSDNTYDCALDPKRHTFQLSVTNVDSDNKLEPNVPNIQDRLKFFDKLKSQGFKVGIRIQPCIPNVSTLDIVKMFKDADHFTIEGLKLVPQNAEHKEYMLKLTGLSNSDFLQRGLLNLRPEIRYQMYQPFIEYFEDNHMSYSISDNDMRILSNNYCCCGDALIPHATNINTTYMVMKYGENYTKQQMDYELKRSGIAGCTCNQLFTSNRQEGCKTVQEFYDKRFERKSSPFSPKYQLDISKFKADNEICKVS